jgi:cytochrome c oxidase cbb3-type subunit 3
MQVRIGWAAALLLALTIGVAAQAPPQPQGGRGGRAGGFVPGQQRPAGDPAQIERGKALYGINCTSCHGADLRGGDMGGPNLLRSQVALSDKDGELIVPIIEGSRQNSGMPAIPIKAEDAKAVAAYVRSIMATIGRQGMPPSVGKAPPTILVGDAAAGQTYFAAKCASCHSATGDLQGVATRISDPKQLQNTWVSGGGGRRGGGGGGRGAAPGPADPRAVMVTVAMPSGEKLEGRLVLIDDFLVSLRLADDTVHTVSRNGDVPKVEVHDPMKAHRDLLSVYTDKDMHDVTAYLVTLK